MTVYVDDASIAATVGPHTARWSHLFADSQAELHAFADQIGLRREWFQQGSPCGDGSPSPHWHYDVTTGKRRQALAFGARPVAWRDAPRMRERDARVAEAVPAAGVRPTGQEPEHLHAWQDSGRLQKTCHGCETVASRERGESGAWSRRTGRPCGRRPLSGSVQPGSAQRTRDYSRSSITTPPSRRQRNHG